MIPARLYIRSLQVFSTETGLIKSWPFSCTQTSWPTKHLSFVVRGLHSDHNGANEETQKLAQSLFMDEDIGAEHGEGFKTFRPRGPLKVDVDYLNDRMRERGLQRIRYAMKPDEAFGLIYLWDNVLADTRALKLDAWRQLAFEEGKTLEDDKEILKHILSMRTENVLKRVLRWVDANSSIDHFKARLAKIYYEKLSKVRAPREGLKEWLEALATAGVPCAVASSLDRFNLLAALQRMGLYKYFQAVITQEDGMDSIAHRFLSAAVKLDRPPSKCVVFEDDPRGIVAAHNCSMKAVALIGSHPVYELTQADLAVGSFSELSVINLRRLFANKGTEFMDLQKQPAEKNPPKRHTTTDTSSLAYKESRTGMKTNIDWLNLTHEEFEDELYKLRQKVPNFSPAMFCEQESKAFYARRTMAARKLSEEIVNIVGDNDLVAVLDDLRSTS